MGEVGAKEGLVLAKPDVFYLVFFKESKSGAWREFTLEKIFGNLSFFRVLKGADDMAHINGIVGKAGKKIAIELTGENGLISIGIFVKEVEGFKFGFLDVEIGGVFKMIGGLFAESIEVGRNGDKD